MESSTSLVKIFVSSRNDDDIVLRLEKLPNLWIEAADNAGDIERFVQKEVIRCKEDGDLFRGSVTDELLEKIVSSLTTRSQGMYEYKVFLMHLMHCLPGHSSNRWLKVSMGRPSNQTHIYAPWIPRRISRRD